MCTYIVTCLFTYYNIYECLNSKFCIYVLVIVVYMSHSSLSTIRFFMLAFVKRNIKSEYKV